MKPECNPKHHKSLQGSAFITVPGGDHFFINFNSQKSILNNGNSMTDCDEVMMHCAPTDQLAKVQRGSELCLPAPIGL